MASPPYHHNYNSAISPPYPSNAQLPQPPKRKQSDIPTSAPKRRKASMLSTTSAGSLHPLRQTSFPPENSGQPQRYSRSPSAETMVSSSVSGLGKTKKRKARKSKGGAKDDASVADNKSSNSVPSGNNKRRASNAGLDEEEEGDEIQVVNVMNRTTEEETKRDMQRQALLARNLDSVQMARYEIYRGVKFQDSVIKRLVNQTLSQSAPSGVIQSFRYVLKIFVGDLVESARKVQTQWLERTREDQTTGLPSPPSEDKEQTQMETRRGPLLPDHLREAMRRLKLTREGGLVGLLGVWHSQHGGGMERFGSRVQGKRLLK
ncbi:hypothetical protein BJ875DRAFT_176488 [Amylocarpus encephaloides]|uniref:TAFII28-like protein domain-containing protein n=1 Tax=Amylocarpus encephaloides TaxID=45428 RepID=A0A9P7Y9W5_9HELO|nr:hypothetical protein BJ875DRAFT_176488 [Amylocarpus encephaloides]